MSSIVYIVGAVVIMGFVLKMMGLYKGGEPLPGVPAPHTGPSRVGPRRGRRMLAEHQPPLGPSRHALGSFEWRRK